MRLSAVVERLPVAAIHVGKRHRKELGDVAELAASIEDIGLLHPIVVTPDGQLMAGARRLAACKKLGWKRIPVNVVKERP
jgi:ParB family transcriptional regulator, chromosome partitioning protein